MTSGFVLSGNQRLHYLQWGDGSRLLLALHGYSNSAGIFAALAASLMQEYTVIALDMPHHGRSEWENDEPWSQDALMGTVRELMQQYKADKVALTGFSLGGRVCLKLAELMPQYIARITLIAPDGLVPNRFYRFVTKNPAGKRLFAHFLERPEEYMNLFSWLERRNLLDTSKRKFVEQYVSAQQARSFLKKVWPNLRLLVPDGDKVRRNVAWYGFPVHVFMGRHDRVIPLEHAIRFAAGAPGVHLHMLEKGHRVMDETSIGMIAESLL
jgi:pimeloyl-ACP methyl ester carboxylesterase